MSDYQQQYQSYFDEIERYLQGLFMGGQPYDRLQEAMRYSLLAGGKRVRPVLTLAFCEALGGQRQSALPLACALELVHTYSLIHDDLPCMDDDELRRGQPTCHTVYGEATAVLAGDALQAEAFRLMAQAPELSGEQRADAVLELARACGGDGMVAGQLMDVEQIVTNEEELRLMCGLKTGAMIQAAAVLGCVAADASGETRERARAYGRHIGLAFQIRDDMLDVTASETELGKPVGSDRSEGKHTFADMLGLEGCAAAVAEETRLAKEAVEGLDGSGFLCRLADTLADRRM
ncbi:MAG: polyprenyl synthetase family protein [Oscillospiraceae bacterium]|nr:polyprenyl synthetase family protein [Oscillospiraceae bacterium]